MKYTFKILFKSIIFEFIIFVLNSIVISFFWNLNQYISIDPGKLHPFLPCGVVNMKTHSHNNKKRKEWEGKERKDNYWLTEALDEIKYERKITQSCSIHKDYDGHSSNIQIERDYSCDVLFCVYMGNSRTQQWIVEHYSSS